MDPLDAEGARRDLGLALGVAPPASSSAPSRPSSECATEARAVALHTSSRSSRFLRNARPHDPAVPGVLGDFEAEARTPRSRSRSNGTTRPKQGRPDRKKRAEEAADVSDLGDAASAVEDDSAEPTGTETGRIAISRADTDALAAADRAGRARTPPARRRARPSPPACDRPPVRPGTLADGDPANAAEPAKSPRKRDSTRNREEGARPDRAIRKVAITPAGAARRRRRSCSRPLNATPTRSRVPHA